MNAVHIAQQFAQPFSQVLAATYLATLLEIQADFATVSAQAEEALRLARILIDHDTPAKGIYGLAAVAAFNVGEFEAAERYYQVAKEIKAVDEDTDRIFSNLEYYRQAWPREAKLRAAEAKAKAPSASRNMSRSRVIWCRKLSRSRPPCQAAIPPPRAPSKPGRPRTGT